MGHVAGRLCLAAGCLLPSLALGLNLTLDANARMAQEFNTNIFFSTQPHPDAYGQGLDGGFVATAQGRRWSSAITSNIFNRWYVTDSNLNYFNQLFDWKSDYFGDKSRLQMDAQYNNDTTLTSLADIPTQVGFVFKRVPKVGQILAPRWSYTLTPRTQLSTGYSYQNTQYQEHQPSCGLDSFPDCLGDANSKSSQLFPNSLANLGTLELKHQWSPRLKLSASSMYSDYALAFATQAQRATVLRDFGGFVFPVDGVVVTPPIHSAIHTANITVGFEYAWTPTFQVTLSGGVQRNDTNRPAYSEATIATAFPRGNPQRVEGSRVAALSSESYSEIFSASAFKTLDSGRVGLEFSRNLSPNILGDLITYDRVTVSGQHRFSPQLETNLGVSFLDQSFPGGSAQTSPTLINQNRQVFSVDSSLSWQFDRNWYLNGSYRFFFVDYEEQNATADSHGLYVYLRYLLDQQRF